MTSPPPLFDNRQQPGVFDWGIGFGAALACHLAGSRCWETHFAAQLAEAWPQLHHPGGAFAHPAVSRLRCLIAAQAAQATCRLILIGTTQAAAPAFAPDLDEHWSASLADPSARLAADLCRQAVRRLREIEATSPDEWAAAAVIHAQQQLHHLPVRAKTAVHLDQLNHRLAALWTARLEAARVSESSSPLPETFAIHFTNWFLQLHLQLLHLHLQSPDDDCRRFLDELQQRLHHTPIPRSFQHQQPQTPCWARRHLQRLQWLHARGVGFFHPPDSLPPLAEMQAQEIARDSESLWTSREWMHDYLDLARRLPGEPGRDWLLLLGDRHLQVLDGQPRSLPWPLPRTLPAEAAASYRNSFIHWLADLLPTTATVEWLRLCLQSGNRKIRHETLLPLAALAPAPSTRSWLETTVTNPHQQNENLPHFAVMALAHVWPDESTRTFLGATALNLRIGSYAREAAIACLHRIWPDENTRAVLESAAGNFEDDETDHSEGTPRQTAMKLLIKSWPDPRTRALLERVIIHDDNGYVRWQFRIILNEHWPPPTDRAALEALLDGPASANPYNHRELLDLLASHWPDAATRTRLIRRITPDTGTNLVESAVNILARHWPDPAAQTDLVDALISWIRSEKGGNGTPGRSVMRRLVSLMPRQQLRALLEEHPDRNAFLLAEWFPDERTRELLQRLFLKQSQPCPAMLLAETFPDRATRDFLLTHGVSQPFASPGQITRVLRVLATWWPDEIVREHLEACLHDARFTNVVMLSEVYATIAPIADTLATLLKAATEERSLERRNSLYCALLALARKMQDNQKPPVWLRALLIALVEGDLEAGHDLQQGALRQLAKMFPNEETRRYVEDIASVPDIPLPPGQHCHPGNVLRLCARSLLAGQWPDERSFQFLRQLAARGLRLPDHIRHELDAAARIEQWRASLHACNDGCLPVAEAGHGVHGPDTQPG